MSHLLNEDVGGEFFSDEFPIFYRNKIKKSKESYYYRSAIDRALKCNQVRAVSLIIDYVCKYQNNYVSSYLFMKNLPILLDKGIEVHDLLDCDVFSLKFDYDEWPGAHTNDETLLRPYNESIFQIRKHYKTVFFEDEFKSLQDKKEENAGEEIDVTKVYKIKYSINILPGVGMYIMDKDPENDGK
jgi:hypothetical protein